MSNYEELFVEADSLEDKKMSCPRIRFSKSKCVLWMIWTMEFYCQTLFNNCVVKCKSSKQLFFQLAVASQYSFWVQNKDAKTNERPTLVLFRCFIAEFSFWFLKKSLQVYLHDYEYENNHKLAHFATNLSTRRDIWIDLIPRNVMSFNFSIFSGRISMKMWKNQLHFRKKIVRTSKSDPLFRKRYQPELTQRFWEVLHLLPETCHLWQKWRTRREYKC